MAARDAEFDVFKAIADPNRRAIVAALAERPKAVHEISLGFPISRPAISRHLSLLADAGLVVCRRRGKENLYSLQAEALNEVAEWLGRYWGGRLSLLKRIAEGDG